MLPAGDIYTAGMMLPAGDIHTARMMLPAGDIHNARMMLPAGDIYTARTMLPAGDIHVNQQAALPVHYTTSCKHSLVLPKMGETIARNMLT